MEYIYKPQGVCSSEMVIQVEGDIVESLKIKRGCPGNATGIAALAQGMTIDELINRLKGIRCGLRPTSCPDQLARALEEIQAERQAQSVEVAAKQM